MRYWIWWNDLIQGPFELDELVSLHAFSESLLVCMDGREDWVPAGRVADLAPAIEQLRISRERPVVPPPLPPNRPPTATPLQGEFFADPPGQQSLLDTDDGLKGPYAYRPVADDAESSASYLCARVTMPFHFSQAPAASLDPAAAPLHSPVVTLPRPKPKRIEYVAPPVITESPVPKEALPEPVVLAVLHEAPSQAPFLDEPYAPQRNIEWLPWIMGVVLVLAAVGSMGYWLLDRASSHSAITEANRLEPPAAISLPATTPLPAPKAAIRDIPVPATVVHPARPRAKRQSIISLTRGKIRTLIAALKKAIRVSSRAPAVPVTLQPPALASVPLRPAAQSVKAAIVPTPVAPRAPLIRKKPAPKRVSQVAVPRKPAPVPELKRATIPLPGLSSDSPEIPPVDSATPLAAPRAVDRWAGRQEDAIRLVMAKTLPKSNLTVGSQAKTMLKQMHEKELMHAAETGERLYLPDKMAWVALQEDAARYRVYLNFQAMQANGERVQTRSYQFIVDLKGKTIRADDPATEQDLLVQNAESNFKHNPMATDIDSILGGVDTYNKHKVQMIIIRKNRSNRDQRTKIDMALKTSRDKLQRAIIYFRRTYPDKALQNVAKAYNFLEIANGK